MFLDDGSTKEERKMRDETRKILHAPEMGICATCVRVPVFNGHAVSIMAEFRDPIDVDHARDWLRQGRGILLQDDPAKQEYPTPVDADGQDMTFVGRVRRDPSHPNALALWCVADNLRKGAATNAVQIAEIWCATTWPADFCRPTDPRTVCFPHADSEACRSLRHPGHFCHRPH